MANALYDAGRNAFLTAGVNWTSDTIKVVMVTSGYTVNLSTHANLSDVGAGTRVATATLTSPTASAGVADAADTTFTAVSGSAVAALVIYKDTGVAGTSTLIAYLDTVTGLPFTPSGGDVTIVYDNGANRIFKL